MTTNTQFVCGALWMLCILVIVDEDFAALIDYTFNVMFIGIANFFIRIINLIFYPIFWLEYQVLMYFERQRIKREIELQVEDLITEHLNQNNDETQP